MRLFPSDQRNLSRAYIADVAALYCLGVLLAVVGAAVVGLLGAPLAHGVVDAFRLLTRSLAG
jgi:hypothetical protein